MVEVYRDVISGTGIPRSSQIAKLTLEINSDRIVMVRFVVEIIKYYYYFLRQ